MKYSIETTINGKLPPEATEIWIKKILAKAITATSFKQAEIGVVFADAKKMEELNRTYHGKKGATDVLSFAYHGKGEKLMQGDIVICVPFVKKNLKDKKTLKNEWCRLLVHGVLHLGGYDHATEKQEARMFAIQELLVEDIC